MYSHVWCPQHYPLYHLFLSAIASIFVGFVLIDLHRIQNGNLIRNSLWNSMLNWMLLMLWKPLILIKYDEADFI